MPRYVSQADRNAIEASSGEDQPLLFLTITHADLEDPVRIVNDIGTVNGKPAEWVFGGETFIAFPFSAELLTDTDAPPRGQLEVANVDRAIGEAILAISGPPSVEIVAVLPSEFDTSAHPRTEIGTASRIFTATGLKLRDVEVDAVSIRGTIMSIDDTAEPYPATRATKALLPGLYR